MAEIRSNEQAADAAPPLRPGLYIVATPIGNLGDISRRAAETLRRVDVVACEDTRVTAKLLNALLIKKPMLAYHEHNAAVQRPRLLEKIEAGQAVALVSDAGTPLISDPGYKLVEDAAAAGQYVTTLPGPSAVIAALTLAGLPTDKFLFLGFAPNKTKARRDWFSAAGKSPATLVYYESAKRLAASLEDAAATFGTRQAAVCRELSKKFEEVVRDDLSALAGRYQSSGPPKGEIVVVIAPPDEGAAAPSETLVETDKLLTAALKHMSVKSAAAFVAEVTGERKSILYKQALALTSDSKD